MHRALGLALSAAVLSLATSVGAASAASADPGVPPPQTGSHVHTVRNVCDAAPAGFARCTSRIRTDSDATLARPASGKNPTKVRPDVLGNNGAYDPSYLQSAYVTPSSSSGTGQTVAIVDAYDDPNAEADLANYRSYFGLPACSSSTGCFRKVNQNGQASPLPTSNASWSQEISLDLDMVSAICPSCNILLVEGNSASYSDLGTAVNSAVSLGAAAVSNSYGGSEFSTESNYDGDYNHPGVAVTVSSGDNGYGVEYPAASQYVTAVGGTSLNQATNTGTRNATETVWSGAGSGCSTYETKPSWQKDAGCAKRTVADVSAVADPNTGVWVYDTYAYQGQSGW
ncbi:MAG TPA: peptidase S8, partial [Chloroflexota bacterium]